MIHNIPIKTIVSIALVLVALGSFYLYFTSPVSASAGGGTPKLEYKILAPANILSGAYKVYGKEPLGTWAAKLIITNSGTAPAYNVRPNYIVEGYSGWAEGKSYPILLPGSTVVDLYYPLLSDTIMKLTTSTPSKVKYKITYSETKEGALKEISESKNIEILGGHDFVFTSIPPEKSTGSFYDAFSNYPLLASWITPTDPVVMKFADAGNKVAGGAAAKLSDEDAIKSLNGMWSLSVANGISYKTEPDAFWTGQFSQYLKYPRDVLKDKAGTCIDTAIFFASLAMSQGLESYVILMTGHAFPVVKLPISGNLIPIESTQLNNKTTFEDAVKSGEESFNKAMKGPYLVIDIKSFQISGITPPQLEALPEDVFKQWNVKETLDGTTAAETGDTATGTESDYATDIVGANLKVYSNTTTPEWAITYPSNWSLKKNGATEIILTSPDTKSEVLVSWLPSETKENMRNYIEAAITTIGSFDALTITQQKISNLYDADVVTYNTSIYSTGETGRAVGKYFSTGTYAFAFFYDTLNPNVQASMNELNDIAATFVVGGN
ncbi:MAG: cysteine protease [Candidatus Diapherotrites archaeon CG08_land_8_20_14_0_20_34_12]|nr:MAG: cysteine protease [Candidatus Diapherotrites archaeon CG08_land_8_20_14_0_20_34_12]